MLLEIVCSLAGLFLMGIEAAYVPTDGGGGDYILRVEPDLVRSASPYTFTSDVPAAGPHRLPPAPRRAARNRPRRSSRAARRGHRPARRW